MRRALLVPLLSLGLLAGPALVASANGPDPAQLPAAAADRATEALQAVKDALAGRGDRKGEVTMALVELRQSYRSLSPRQRKQADAIFARPTQGAGDPQHDGYTVGEATPVCSAHFCVHYVRSTADAPPLADTTPANGVPDHVERTLTRMEQVWNFEIGRLGYRAPATDGALGGGVNKFDVYLKDVGAEKVYGYCAPEEWVTGQPTDYRAFGYCVLDNDFASAQFGGVPPAKTLAVTAAHEFFHAIQFNYDVGEDQWIMEATATWIEERVSDDVNDNRQYLPWGQLGSPGAPLDLSGGAQMYGNWIFFERLSQAYGVAAIRLLWERMDSSRGAASNQYSSQAIRGFLWSRKVPFPTFYSRFAAGNLIPSRVYSEGAAYRPAPVARGYKLTSGARSTGWRALRLNHLTNRNYRFVPGDSLRGRWNLRVKVDLPIPGRGSAAYLIVHRRDGSKVHRPIRLNRYGNATVYVGFSRGTVANVTLTLANGSTRFKDCAYDGAYSCGGIPIDNGLYNKFQATAVR